MVLDLMAQLDREFTERGKVETLLRELLDAKRNRKSEQLSDEQLALFAALWQARQTEREAANAGGAEDDDDNEAGKPGVSSATPGKKPGGRQALPRHLKRERIVRESCRQGKALCPVCAGFASYWRGNVRTLRICSRFAHGNRRSLFEVCVRLHSTDCGKPPQPIEKSIAGASLLAQVIVSKWADHLPLYRQEQIFARYGVALSRKSRGGWMAQCAALLKPLYVSSKKVLFGSKVIGTDDTSVKVLDRKLPFARTGRIWPYYGDQDHPVTLYDYTPTRERAGPDRFLVGYRGYLQADAYGGYDAFFKDPARGLVEVSCWAHSRRYFYKALDSDRARMGPALLLIAQLYRVEKQARQLTAQERLRLRQIYARPILDKLHQYLLEIQAEVLPKSPEGRAVRYALKNWTALNRYSEDGD